MKPPTDEKQKDVFIVDNSLFDRSRSDYNHLCCQGNLKRKAVTGRTGGVRGEIYNLPYPIL